MNVTKTIEKNGYKAEIIQDEEPMNPRTENDNMGKMVCFHRRYDLGDKHTVNSSQFNGWDELEASLRKELDAIIILPLYLYDHSGITMNTTGFSCPWDSGQVGFIYATRQAIKDNYMLKRNITKATIYKATKLLLAEVEEYDQYLTGDVYGIRILKDGGEEGEDKELDSCWGFFGLNYAEKEAQSMLDNAIKGDTVAA
jgi:hypothetical protein